MMLASLQEMVLIPKALNIQLDIWRRMFIHFIAESGNKKNHLYVSLL